MSLSEQEKQILIELHIQKALGNITEDGVKFNIGLLQQYGALKRVGGRKIGHWEVTKGQSTK